jgi:hypothetical protein
MRIDPKRGIENTFITAAEANGSHALYAVESPLREERDAENGRT